MSLPLGIGLVGLGRWGRNYLGTLLALPECRLVAVADPNPLARVAVTDLAGVETHGSVEEMLSSPSIEAVVIATPDRTHYVLAGAALASGRDVLVEKPMALTPAEAESLLEQAESEKRVLAVGHTAVYQAGFAELASEVRTWPTAADRRATAVRTSSGYTDGRSNPILDLCPHDVALAVLLFGIPVSARARTDGSRVEYQMRFAHGALLNGQAEWCQPPHVREFRVAGARHTLGNKAHVTEPSDVRSTPLGRQCLDFVECCRTRRQPVSSGRVGRAVVDCLSALGSSCADSGAWVQISPGFRKSNTECRALNTAAPEMEVRA